MDASTPLNLSGIRARFPGLQRQQSGAAVVFLDGPAGSQVPQSVADAVSHYLLHTNANRGAAHASSHESDSVLEAAHQVLATFLNAATPQEVIFGANMTTVTLAVSRALSKSWIRGDEIIVTRLDHDANVTPWVLAAQDAGATVRYVDLNPDDWTLNQQDFEQQLSDRTRLVAFGYASNATGTINPVSEMVQQARRVGALTYVDAVHYAPHGLIDVAELQCDFLACSAYKFFGPHVGILYGRAELLQGVRPYKLRPSPDDLPGRWMTGTQNHEGIAGAAAAVQYLAALSDGPKDESLRQRLQRAFAVVQDHERGLSRHVLERLKSLSGVRLHGISDLNRLPQRVPTFSFTFDRLNPSKVAEEMAQQGIYCWAGNHYALPFTEAAGLEPGGTLRIGALHYNSVDEIDRAFDCLAGIL